MLVLKAVKEEKANLEAEHAKLLEECKQLQEEIGELRYENHTLNETIGKLERWYVENIWFDDVEMSYYFKKWKSSLFFVSWLFVVCVPRCYLFVHLHCIRDFEGLFAWRWGTPGRWGNHTFFTDPIFFHYC